jgi:hypothetical protein
MNLLSRRTALAMLAGAAFCVSSCGGGSGSSGSNQVSCTNTAGLSASFSNPGGANSVALTIDDGPTVSGAPVGALNQAYVTITVCAPGSMTACQNIDHVWVDTGSTGLRIISSALSVSLPPSQASATPIGTCGQFISSYTWGALRTADIKIGGESASSVPVQVIGDGSVPGTAPNSCSTSGASTNMNTVSALGANALLGIGLFLQDCGPNCAPPNAPPAMDPYYLCPSTTSACTATTVAVNQQLQNVVGMFTTDNNGSLMQIPEIPAQGQATAGGWLIFGINTQSNNQLGSALVFQADTQGYINTNTTYGVTANPSSYVDSGSNGWFIDDPALTVCSGANNSWFCSTAMLAATLTTCTTTGCAGLPQVSNTYDFCIASLNNLNTTSFAAFNDLGGPVGSTNAGTFDWGLPFFYGRSVFTALEGTTINSSAGPTNGPFFAASTP